MATTRTVTVPVIAVPARFVQLDKHVFNVEQIVAVENTARNRVRVHLRGGVRLTVDLPMSKVAEALSTEYTEVEW